MIARLEKNSDQALACIATPMKPSAAATILNDPSGICERKSSEDTALVVSSSPLTRSSYHADDDFRKLQDARNKKLECLQQK